MYTAVHRQTSLTLSSQIVEDSNSGGTVYNSAYVSEVFSESLIAKSTMQQFFGQNF